MKHLFFILLAGATVSVIAQNRGSGFEKDSHTFFSLGGGIQQTKFTSREPLFDDMDGNTGYSIALSMTHFPDFEYSNLLIRTSFYYSAESSEKDGAQFQGNAITTNAEFNAVGLDFFLAYRFSLNTNTIPYIGGGIGYQFSVTESAERFIINSQGETISFYGNNDPSLPIRFGNDAPSGLIPIYLESGVYLKLKNRYLGINGRVGYGFISGGNAQDEKLTRSVLVLHLNYELF